MTMDEHVDCDRQLCEAEDKIIELNKQIEELKAENKKMKALKCPPIESGDSCICPIEELEIILIKKDERIEKFETVISRCIKAMAGSNCLELQWLEKALKGGK